MDELCLHDLPVGQCSHCKQPPHGIYKVVYVTAGGTSFHNIPYCATLKTGQDEAEALGLEIHPINPIGWAEAFNTRKACRNCCSDFIRQEKGN
jgi:hypothetical protein